MSLQVDYLSTSNKTLPLTEHKFIYLTARIPNKVTLSVLQKQFFLS